MIDHINDFADAPKKATNLSLNSKVLKAARDLGINVSQTVDALLAQEVRRLSMARWVAENGKTVDAYNKRIEERGLWNADLRKLRGQI
jgi:antitoxin CcdA